jgi:hypothetical protein
VCERNLPANHTFEGGERLILSKIGLISSIEEKHASLHEKPSMLQAGTSSSLFPGEN